MRKFEVKLNRETLQQTFLIDDVEVTKEEYFIEMNKDLFGER